jgi:hypothetical protein
MISIEQAKLEVVAEFPKGYFLENLAIRADGSILVSAMNKSELWYIPAPASSLPVKPVLVHTFDLMTLNIVETAEEDVFYLTASNVYTTRVSHLYRLDFRGWEPGDTLRPQLLLEFPEPKVGLNGSCLVAPNVLLAAGATSLIWRVDLPTDGTPASARVWMEHDNMKMRPGEKKPEQPGVNGIRYAARSGYLYYTSTSQQLMMRVPVNQETLEPAGLPKFVAGGRYWDDFVLDEEAEIAYVTTHRENTIDHVLMRADGNRAGFTVAAGNPFTETLVGPSSGVWRRGPGDYGRVAYFTTDGGTAQSPDGVSRTAKLLLVTFPRLGVESSGV